MPGPVTVDASVFMNAFNPYEAGHELSRAALQRLQAEGTPMVEPTLLLPEVASAARRGRGDPALAVEFARNLAVLPQLVLIPLDENLARQAADVAAVHGLRESDAVYAAVALRFGASMLTLDLQQQARMPAVVPTSTPADFA